LTSIATTRCATFFNARAAPSKSATLRPQIDAITRAPLASNAGRSRVIHESTPGPGRPTELIIPPPGASATRSGGLPSDAKTATDFAVTAPMPRGSQSAATSAPWPNVPDAATIGFGTCTGPSAVPGSTPVGRARFLIAPSHLEPELAAGVVLLQRANLGVASCLLGDARGRRERGRDGRDAGDAVDDRGPPDVHSVGPRSAPARRVHDEIDLAGRDEIERVDAVAVLPHLGDDRVDPDAIALEEACGSDGRRDRESELEEAQGRDHPCLLVAVGEREKHGAVVWKRVARAGLALREGQAERAVDTHDLAGGAHLRAENRVDIGKAVEREHRFLHGDVAPGR